MKYITVSAKVKRKLYEKLRSYRIPISSIIRKALEEEVKRREEEIKNALERAQAILKKIPLKEIVDAVRISREER
jgi:post-segregation antitoxin (ccd killing protein)